jgi:DNA-binding NarL/FixJ family response regulator
VPRRRRGTTRAVCEAAGHRIKKRASGWPAGLSDREVEVLRHLARGCSEKKIGELLFISPGTVHTHVVHVYEKIGVSTMAPVDFGYPVEGLAYPLQPMNRSSPT